MSKEQLERKIFLKDIVPKIKCLILMKYVQNLYAENYKTVLRQMERHTTSIIYTVEECSILLRYQFSPNGSAGSMQSQ